MPDAIADGGPAGDSRVRTQFRRSLSIQRAQIDDLGALPAPSGPSTTMNFPLHIHNATIVHARGPATECQRIRRWAGPLRRGYLANPSVSAESGSMAWLG